MSREPIKITCDGCGQDITSTQYAYEFNLSLTATPRINDSGFSFDMGLNQSIDEQKDFCGLGCLKKWMNQL